MRRLVRSFSGGATSGYMCRLLDMPQYRSMWDEVITIFANTGEENEQTLEFANRCDKEFGFNLVWVECVPYYGQRRSSGHRVVNFETASRRGEPYEAMIKKYGIPNSAYPHCTRELKLAPMRSYLEAAGWEFGTYDTAVGIRADEAERRSATAKQNRLLYPLLDLKPTTKPQVNEWWAKQPFQLELTGYQGNCKWCYKKTMRKLFTIMDETPEAFDFPARMESLYGKLGPEFEKDVKPEYRRVFFRKHTSTQQLREAFKALNGNFDRAEDDSKALPIRDLFSMLDEQEGPEGCVESCEVNFEEALEMSDKPDAALAKVGK